MNFRQQKLTQKTKIIKNLAIILYTYYCNPTYETTFNIFKQPKFIDDIKIVKQKDRVIEKRELFLDRNIARNKDKLDGRKVRQKDSQIERW